MPWVDYVKNIRENFLISGIVLIVSGAILTLSVNIVMGAISGVSGIICFVIGMSINSNMEMSPEAVRSWMPSSELLPDAGRFMYRVDVTLDDPIKTTVLCGPCGDLEIINGPKPSSYTCKSCGKFLWSEESE